MINGDDPLTEISLFEAKLGEQRRHCQDDNYANAMYQFKLTKNLFLSRGYEHVSSLARWNRLYIDTKILLSSTACWDIFPYKHPGTMPP